MKLEIGERVAKSNGDVQIPGDTNDTAYWVEDTSENMLFLLSPTIENLSLVTSLAEGQTGKVTWPDCSWKEYALQAVQPAGVDLAGYFEQFTDGITIVVRDGASYTLVVSGSMTGKEIAAVSEPLAEEVVTIVPPSGQVSGPTAVVPREEATLAPTPAPESIVLPDLSEYDNILAEIELKNVSRSGDTIRIDISIKNMGQSDIIFRNIDISLHPENGNPIIPLSSQPALPQKISSWEAKAFSITFTNINSPNTTLRIYIAEYDLNDF
jgi:hypothetical protein